MVALTHILAPIQEMSIMQVYMQKVIRGPFITTMCSAFTDTSLTSVATLSSLEISSFSRTKVFTTLMPRTFSCMTALSLSKSLNILSNSGKAFFMIRNSPTASTGSTQTNIHGSLLLILNAATSAKMTLVGALKSILVSIM